MLRICVIALLLGITAVAANAQSPKFDGEVEKLLQERVELLREVAKMKREMYVVGRADLLDVLAAIRLKNEAELELAATTADRMRIREALLKDSQELEMSAKGRFEAGVTSTVEWKMAQAARLRAQADLLLEKKAAAQ